MNCHDVRISLDHPDRAADDALSPDILAHIEDCADCRRYRERLAALLDPSSVLAREIQPPRDLWPGIANRLETGDERKIRRLPSFLPLAAAAGIAAVAIASLLSLPPRQNPTVAALPVQTPEIAPMRAPAPLPAAQVEIGFVQTRAALMKLAEARKRAMAPEQVSVLEYTLATINSAVQDIHAALELEPHNSFLLFELSDTRRQELRILQKAIL